MAEGSIYVLMNEAMPVYTKIGKTRDKGVILLFHRDKGVILLFHRIAAFQRVIG